MLFESLSDGCEFPCATKACWPMRRRDRAIRDSVPGCPSWWRGIFDASSLSFVSSCWRAWELRLGADCRCVPPLKNFSQCRVVCRIRNGQSSLSPNESC
ncbi:hypothetical protein B0T14DRAFT_12933 [Immersiella caudata]|uniref:Uncharacterized protein n=1 Tax=Immersiella caudata TaxID=314043 RepID=A0AA40CB39_9PEZI|nr:hypothetical protein B0T14DRAFT_12933 [Immersiella caudata]